MVKSNNKHPQRSKIEETTDRTQGQKIIQKLNPRTQFEAAHQCYRINGANRTPKLNDFN